MMDFIERLFGISPDGGSGATEILWLLAFAAAALFVAFLAGRKVLRKRRF
jgi:hypothetical protein